MRKATLLLLLLPAFAVFANAQTSTPPATQSSPSSPTSTDPNATATPNPSSPQSTMPPDTAPPQTGASTGQTADQTNQTVQTAPGAAGEVAANTQIRATLDTPLSTKTSKVGDTFTATVAEPVHSSSGQVLIPSGSRIQGEVTEAEEGKAVAVLRGKGKLNMHFRDIQLPDGSTVPLSATLVSVNNTKGGKKASTNSEGQVQAGNTGTRTARDVGIGAGVGTVAGLIFGGALKGLAIGALAGGGYVLATNGKQVELPAQTGLVLRLDHGLSVPATTSSR